LLTVSDKFINIVQHEWATIKGAIELVDARFLLMLIPLVIQLITLQDVAPIIGWIVLIAIVLVILFIIFKLIQYWSEQAEEEYAREHPEYVRPPDSEDQR